MRFPLRRVLVLLACSTALLRADTETIVLFRHGEKTPRELGQLSVVGLNRALALPPVLQAKFGRPQFLFAPDPDRNLVGGKHGEPFHDYVRALATLEPTAIELGMPVDTRFGFKEVDQLETELLKPRYRNVVVFVCWEHVFGDKFAKRLMKDLSGSSEPVPDWPSDDYDSLFVFRIDRAGGRTTATLTRDHEGLGRPSGQAPRPAP